MQRSPLAKWMLAFAVGTYVVTVFTAALLVFRWEGAGSLAEVFVWQALVYGSWLPMAAVVWKMFKTRGLSSPATTRFILLGLVAVPAHAIFTTFIDISFGSADLFALAVARFQVDTLTYAGFGLVAIAAAFRKRADDEAAAAAEVTAALTAARTQSSEPTAREPMRLLVSTGNSRTLIAAEDVEWFGSAGNYVVVNWAEREGLIRKTLQSLELQLDPLVFARGHRSTIVNLSKVAAAEPLSDGSWKLSMRSGAEVVVSRTYRDEILRRIG